MYYCVKHRWPMKKEAINKIKSLCPHIGLYHEGQSPDNINGYCFEPDNLDDNGLNCKLLTKNCECVK